MSAAATPYSTPHQGSLSRLVRAGLLTGVTDGLFSSVLSVAFYHSTVERLFQGGASTLLGPDALDGGIRTAAVGVRPPKISLRWWVQLLGQIPFVGLPIAASIAGTAPRQSGNG